MSVPPVGTSPLRDYVAAKHEVATLVTEALDLLREHRPESAVVAEELIVKLAEDRFNLAVVGQFKRGKSTLMNAVLEDAVRSPGRREGPRPRRHTPTSGCPICATQSQAIFQFFAQWQQQLATDRRAQRAFAAAGGFCPGHTWQFQQLAAPQDLSVGYAPLVELLQRDVARAAAEPPLVAASRLKDRLSSSEHCPACRVLRDTERSSLLEHLARIAAGGESGQAALEAGWCLAHLRAALQTDLGPATARRLLEEQAEQLEVTLEDMRSYSLKRTAVRRGIINTREAEAWRRALVQLVGERAARGVVLGDDDASWGA